jgi:cell division protein FtsB
LKQEVNLGIWHRLSQVVIGLIVLACFLGIFFWYLPVFQKNARLRARILELEKAVKTETALQAQLQLSINSLLNDPKTLERTARQKMGYAKPGETVIYFKSPAQVAAPMREP